MSLSGSINTKASSGLHNKHFAKTCKTQFVCWCSMIHKGGHKCWNSYSAGSPVGSDQIMLKHAMHTVTDLCEILLIVFVNILTNLYFLALCVRPTILASSSADSATLSRSLLSTTKIRPYRAKDRVKVNRFIFWFILTNKWMS